MYLLSDNSTAPSGEVEDVQSSFPGFDGFTCLLYFGGFYGIDSEQYKVADAGHGSSAARRYKVRVSAPTCYGGTYSTAADPDTCIGKLAGASLGPFLRQ